MPFKVNIYTDGASSGNPGPGGFGVVMISGVHRKEFSKGFKLTTNNRMELLAVIAGLESLKTEGCEVTIYTDSKYVSESVENGWVFAWEKARFKKKKNPDLWQRFLKIYRKHKVKFIWIKGHNNNPENEKCDKLAVEASQGPKLFEDEGYINDLNEAINGFD